jgi:SAM-dependent methyltransferase
MTSRVKRFIEVIAKTYLLEDPIVEIGSYLVAGQEDLANIRPFFEGENFIGCDIRRGPGVDRIEDVEKLTFTNKSISTIIILETLEHIQNPIVAIDECYRVLKDDGILISSSLMNFPIHNYPYDYWRFTPEGFKYLFKRFQIKIIGTSGADLNHPEHVFGIGFKRRNDNRFGKIFSALNANLFYVTGKESLREQLYRFFNRLIKLITKFDWAVKSSFTKIGSSSPRLPLDKD